MSAPWTESPYIRSLLVRILHMLPAAARDIQSPMSGILIDG